MIITNFHSIFLMSLNTPQHSCAEKTSPFASIVSKCRMLLLPILISAAMSGCAHDHIIMMEIDYSDPTPASSPEKDIEKTTDDCRVIRHKPCKVIIRDCGDGKLVKDYYSCA